MNEFTAAGRAINVWYSGEISDKKMGGATAIDDLALASHQDAGVHIQIGRERTKYSVIPSCYSGLNGVHCVQSASRGCSSSSYDSITIR